MTQCAYAPAQHQLSAQQLKGRDNIEEYFIPVKSVSGLGGANYNTDDGGSTPHKLFSRVAGKIPKISDVAYNFGSTGIKCVINVSHDIPSNSKLSFFFFKGMHFMVNMQKQQMSQSGHFPEIIEVSESC